MIHIPLGWVLPIPLQYLYPLIFEELWRAALKWKFPLALDWMDHGWWTDTAVCTSSKDGSTLYPRRWMDWALSLQLWHCSSFIQPDYSPTQRIQSLLCFWFYFSLNFSCFASHLWVRQCVFLSAHVSVFQSKYCKSIWQKSSRQTNVLSPLAYEYTTHPLTLIYM